MVASSQLRRLRLLRLRLRRPGESWSSAAAAQSGRLFLLVTVVGVLSHAVACTWQPLIVTASVSHFVMWAAVPALVLTATGRRRIAAAGAALALALVLAVEIPPLVAETPPSGGATLTVLQANLRVGAADPAALVSLVRENRVDVLATEELTDGEQRRLLAAGLGRALPYRYTAPLPTGGGGLGLWSRYPVTDRHNLPGYQLGVLLAGLSLPDGSRPTFAAVHLLPPYPYGAGEWLAEISRLRTVLAKLGRPDIVAGDFNATVIDHPACPRGRGGVAAHRCAARFRSPRFARRDRAAGTPALTPPLIQQTPTLSPSARGNGRKLPIVVLSAEA